ncbi:MAG: hypothetical protein KQH63_05010 [Desulfobulbaceae bacterium]|nr:hypothetical protein [Desulfobulbaceae bacterium]
MTTTPETPLHYSVDVIRKFDIPDLYQPFGVSPGEVEVVSCTKQLRKVPDSREVYGGSWREKDVIVKLFLDKRRSATHSRREIDGLLALHERQIPAPRPLFCGKVAGDVLIVVLEKIEDSCPVKEIVSSTSYEEQRTWLCKVFEQLALLHQNGVVQHDLHLGNFLARGEALYVLDPAEMQFEQGSVPPKQSLRQLVLLGSDIVHLGHEVFKECIRHYTGARCWQFDGKTVRRLFRKSVRMKKRKIDKKLKKYQRANSLHKKIKDKGFVAIVRRDFDLADEQAFFAAIDTFYEKSSAGRERCGSQPMKKFSRQGKDFLITRFPKKRRWKIRTKTEARLQWLSAHRALLSGTPTRLPVALVEVKGGPGKGFSYFISEAEPNTNQFG